MTENCDATLTQAQIEQFQRDGFLLVEDFFAGQQLDQFAAAVDVAVANRTVDDQRKFDEKSLYEQTFVQCMRLWEDHEDVRPFTFDATLCSAAADLLQSPLVRLWHDQALYKPPGGRKTDAHCDYPFWPADTTDQVSVWIPFQDVEPGFGMMSYVRGSHRIGFKDFVDIGQLHGGEEYDLLQEPTIAAMDLVPVQPRKGSVVFHHSCTIHSADANETDEVRRVMTMAYVADGCRRLHNKPYFSLDRDNIGVGELIAGPGFPIAWPRAGGDWPTPPEQPGPKTGFAFSGS